MCIDAPPSDGPMTVPTLKAAVVSELPSMGASLAAYSPCENRVEPTPNDNAPNANTSVTKSQS
ncbi:Uncharacterised protein [Mycobacteroides abscessus subsp. abscessus]|nr:Uncharacterised protein [Mycobacteroides abscessus subsp. abscessus]